MPTANGERANAVKIPMLKIVKINRIYASMSQNLKKLTRLTIVSP